MKNARIDAVDQTLLLPDHLVHQILSSLPLKEAVRTSLLSKRWKNMWITALPTLQFDFYSLDDDDGDNDENGSKRVDFLNFVERMLRLLHSHSRTRNVCTKKMELYFPVYSSEVATTLDRCIRYAIGCNVKELHLDIYFHQGGLYNLSHIVFIAKSLTQLRLNGCKLEFSSCVNMNFSSLKMLYFLDVSVDDQILQNLIANCPLIEDLKLLFAASNRILKIYGLVNPKLVNVEISGCKFEGVEIEIPGLESFRFSRYVEIPLIEIPRIEINVSTCKNMRTLALVGVAITNEWLHDVLSKLCLLEKLSLSHCDVLESILISSRCLKDLKVNMCRGLFNVEIDVPNLSRFNYAGKNVISFSSNALALLKTDFSFFPRTIDTHWYVRLTECLGKFNNSKSLKLFCKYKNVVVPKELRESLLPPLYNVKHLSVSVASGLPSEEVEEILDGMLWLSPHPESLSIASKFVKVLSLKFQYWEMDREDKGSCCSSLPITCFRHCLERVEIDFGKEEDYGRNTTKFFNEHAKFLKKIILADLLKLPTTRIFLLEFVKRFVRLLE